MATLTAEDICALINNRPFAPGRIVAGHSGYNRDPVAVSNETALHRGITPSAWMTWSLNGRVAVSNETALHRGLYVVVEEWMRQGRGLQRDRPSSRRRQRIGRSFVTVWVAVSNETALHRGVNTSVQLGHIKVAVSNETALHRGVNGPDDT